LLQRPTLDATITTTTTHPAPKTTDTTLVGFRWAPKAHPVEEAVDTPHPAQPSSHPLASLRRTHKLPICNPRDRNTDSDTEARVGSVRRRRSHRTRRTGRCSSIRGHHMLWDHSLPLAPCNLTPCSQGHTRSPCQYTRHGCSRLCTKTELSSPHCHSPGHTRTSVPCRYLSPCSRWDRNTAMNNLHHATSHRIRNGPPGSDRVECSC